MKTLIGILFLLVAGAVLAADTYKWVDEKGVTNYGEKPPKSRPAKPVDTTPNGVIESGGQSDQKTEKSEKAAPERRADVPPAPQPGGPPAPGPVATRGMDFDVFIRLQTGMTEGELLLRAGPPDHKGVENFRHDIVKSYYYYPTTSNPYTTVVTLRGGRIANLERVKKF